MYLPCDAAVHVHCATQLFSMFSGNVFAYLVILFSTQAQIVPILKALCATNILIHLRFTLSQFAMASEPPLLLPPRPPKPAFLSAECTGNRTSPATDCVPQLESDYTEIKAIARSLLLAEVAEHHSQSLPMVVEVSSSLYGMCGSTTLLDGELLSLNFFKETDCVEVQAGKKPKRSIPINSTLQFSVLYNPTDNVDEARKGTMFKSVGKLMSAKTLPRVVCVTGVPSSESACSLVAAGDVLTIKDTKRKRGGKGHMTCHHIRRNQDVKLKECWAAQFSTSPELIKLRLPELLDLIALPVEVVVSMENMAQWKHIKTAFPNETCTVLSRSVETSMIASYGQEGSPRSVLEIPIKFGLLSIRIVQMSPAVKCRLIEETHKLLATFIPGMVDAWISDEVNANCSLLLRKYVCQANPTLGITLVKPDGLEDDYEDVEYEPENKGITKPSVPPTQTSKLQIGYVYQRVNNNKAKWGQSMIVKRRIKEEGKHKTATG